MRKAISLFLLLFCLNLIACYSDEESSSPRPVSSIVFSSPETIWIVTGSGELRKREWGDRIWNKVQVGAAGSLKCVGFLGAGKGWAVNARGKVWHTSDTGRNWSQIGSLDYSNDPYVGPLIKVQFIDESHGWVLDSFSIWRTTDGGRNWQRHFLFGSRNEAKLMYDCHFVSRDRGWISGTDGLLRYTRDGGKTWQGKNIAESDVALGDIIFVNERSGWVCSWPQGRVYRTDDGGVTWQRQRIPNDSMRIDSIHFLNAQEGWAACTDLRGSITNENISGILLHTTDAGENWKIAHRGEKGSFYFFIYFANAQHGWLASHEKEADKFYRSEDGGRTWQLLSTLPETK
jgi:photosystem II stability/assembly factor-like uncharacterized protein